MFDRGSSSTSSTCSTIRQLISYNTAIRPDPASPVDALGLRTGYIEGVNFGEARGVNDYPRSLNEAGGRAFRMSFGVRF